MSRLMAFRMVSSLRMQATRATFVSFPRAVRRAYIARIAGLCVVATTVAM